MSGSVQRAVAAAAAIVLLVALVWTVLRPRQESEQAVAAEGEASTADGTSRTHPSTTDFGAGAR